MKKKAKPKIDWKKLEDALFNLTVADIHRTGVRNPDKKFYGFAFDCDSDSGQVLLCLNTETALERQAILYATDPPNEAAFNKMFAELDAKFGRVSKPEPLKSPAHYKKRLRWSVGDWAYQGFESKAFRKSWKSFQDAVEDAWLATGDEEPNPISEQFMNSACRVMVRLEKANAFRFLSVTPNFATWVSDHDEMDSDSRKRLRSARALASKKTKK